jgi:hypothetical protein
MKQLGDWLVWESKGCTYTLDTDLISSTVYYGPASVCPGKVKVYCRDEAVPLAALTGDDAEWFQAWWMKRLEDEEAEAVICREEERKRREKHAKATGDEEPA